MTTAPYRILIAEDEASTRALARVALEMSGRFTIVAEATTADRAVEMAGLYRPEVVLLDLFMPDGEGISALPRILEAVPDARVVVFSMVDEAMYAPQLLAAGAAAFLPKDIDPDRLVTQLMTLLDGPDQGRPSAPATG